MLAATIHLEQELCVWCVATAVVMGAAVTAMTAIFWWLRGVLCMWSAGRSARIDVRIHKQMIQYLYCLSFLIPSEMKRIFFFECKRIGENDDDEEDDERE